MFKPKRVVLLVICTMAACSVFGASVSAAGGNKFDLSDPAWKINAAETDLVHANSGMHFTQTLGAFELKENKVHDNLGKSVSVIYVGGQGRDSVRATISVQTEERRSIEQCFKVGSAAFGLRYGNVKPYKTANISISTARGKMRGKAAAYNVLDAKENVQKDTRLYMFKMGNTLIKVQTSHPMGFVRGSTMIHNDLLKQMNWASVKR